MEQEEGDEEEERETKPDPLHQLILHFSRTALTEKRLDRSLLVQPHWCQKCGVHTGRHVFSCLLLSSLFPISVNSIQIIFIWHMLTLWQR